MTLRVNPLTYSGEVFDVNSVAGNAPDNIKRLLGNPRAFYESFQDPRKPPVDYFGKAIEKRMVITEISILEKADEPNKLEGRAVLEIVVEQDMVNGGGNIHGGCSAFLIDMASSFALSALNMHRTGNVVPSVSQALNVVYHSPAAIGEKLRLVNTTLTIGARTESVRTEIWNVTHHRLVASGVHIKMMPSQPKPAAL
ncbi:hypothetical protein NLJ89_g9215 [Agrocybe chaxingu]|uniref:Thioesterase domain-containing protein n=1 Tax=Agrocybe chaxingu TaxID=84603 RepID=A0A9W8JTR9_9AGAR|nr:hypothetical protein NLJ89_g9215 [Agrocybe chaxingu]